jgi:mitogen-activated protein kinase kinase
MTIFCSTCELICSLIKEASSRPTYAQLLEHPFLAGEKDKEVDMAGWVAGALEKRAARGVIPLQTVEA